MLCDGKEDEIHCPGDALLHLGGLQTYITSGMIIGKNSREKYMSVITAFH